MSSVCITTQLTHKCNSQNFNFVSSFSRLDRDHLRRYHEYSEREALRPGVTRLNFPYFMSDEAVKYVIDSITLIAKHGWKLLPQVLCVCGVDSAFMCTMILA